MTGNISHNTHTPRTRARGGVGFGLLGLLLSSKVSLRASGGLHSSPRAPSFRRRRCSASLGSPFSSSRSSSPPPLWRPRCARRRPSSRGRIEPQPFRWPFASPPSFACTHRRDDRRRRSHRGDASAEERDRPPYTLTSTTMTSRHRMPPHAVGVGKDMLVLFFFFVLPSTVGSSARHPPTTSRSNLPDVRVMDHRWAADCSSIPFFYAAAVLVVAVVQRVRSDARG